MRYTIAGIIPPRPGSRVGTLIFDPGENPPVESATVDYHWLVATHARVGGRISFMLEDIRYHWEELPKDKQRHGLMDELFPGVTRKLIREFIES